MTFNKYIFVGLNFLALSAQAQNRVGLVGVINNTTFEAQGVTSEPVQKLGYGLLWENSMNGYKGWETGVLYYDRKWAQDSQIKFFQIPFSYNYWLGSYIGIGLGGYFAQGLGNVKLNGVTRTFSEAAMRSQDFGALGSLKVNMPFAIPSLHLLLEIRYNYGLANASSANGISSRYSDVQYLGWLRSQGLR